jgi:hypothetical protein
MNRLLELEAAASSQAIEQNPALGLNLSLGFEVHDGAPTAGFKERARRLTSSGRGSHDSDDLGTEVIAASFHRFDPQTLPRCRMGHETDLPSMSP